MMFDEREIQPAYVAFTHRCEAHGVLLRADIQCGSCLSEIRLRRHKLAEPVLMPMFRATCTIPPEEPSDASEEKVSDVPQDR